MASKWFQYPFRLTCSNNNVYGDTQSSISPYLNWKQMEDALPEPVYIDEQQ